MMRDKRSPYWKGPQSEQLQARYRDLVRAGPEQEKPMPQNAEGVQNELAQIERFMRTNRRAYNADEGMQKRYRELITLKQGA
jgi:hypothetical protein